MIDYVCWVTSHIERESGCRVVFRVSFKVDVKSNWDDTKFL